MWYIELDHSGLNLLAMKSVFNATNSIEAHLIKGMLQSEGIESQILGEFLSGGIGELPPAGLIRVAVHQEDELKAKQIIDDWHNAGKLEA